MRVLRVDQRGVTLVELMVAVAVLATVGLASAMAYNKAMQALVLSKSRGIATRLAQDKFETLRGLAYSSLMVTSQADLDINPPGVDQTYYPQETISMGGKAFTRGVVVSRAYRDSSGNITVLSPSAADTGLKQIKVTVSYLQGGVSETRSYTALVSDPNLIPLDANVYGLVTDTAGAAISNAKVFVTQNQNWTAVASSTGYYQVQMDTRSYTLTATKAGYWDKVSSTVTCTGSCQLGFQLQQRLTGRVTGLMTARPAGMVISGVFAGSSSDPNSHFLELYNPTTYSILITDGLTAKIKLKRIPSDNSINDVAFTWSGTNPISISSQKYFLIATASSTINSVVADAQFSSPASPFSDPYLTKAGAAVQDSFGLAFDTVGWTNDNGNPGPSNGVETRGVYTGGSNWGANGFLVRKSNPTGATLGQGSSVDSKDNSSDVLLSVSVGAGYPRNSGSAAAAVEYGVPASSATALATDGFSAAAFASSTGYYLLSSITTGTWSIGGYWTTYSSVTAGTIQVNSGATTALDLLLEPGSGSQGGVSGKVVRSDTLVPVPDIAMSAGTGSTLTDASGNYVLSLTSGSYTVIANDGFANISYNTLQATVTVPSGGVATGVNFNLVPSGVITGKVTTNGTSAYPNFPVHAVNLGLEIATALTDSSGNYSLYGVPTGSNVVEPVLDSQSQSASPSSITLTVTQGTTHSGNNFTVTDSLGKITGTVKQGSDPITTGVLVIASTTTLASPPDIDNAYRTGSNVLYSIMSDTAGNYSLSVVKSSTYSVYAYFTSLVGSESTSTTLQSASSVYVATTTVKNFQW